MVGATLKTKIGVGYSPKLSMSVKQLDKYLEQRRRTRIKKDVNSILDIILFIPVLCLGGVTQAIYLFYCIGLLKEVMEIHPVFTFIVFMSSVSVMNISLDIYNTYWKKAIGDD